MAEPLGTLDSALVDVLAVQLLALREQVDAALRVVERLKAAAPTSPAAPVVVNSVVANANADADTAAALSKLRAFGGLTAPAPSQQ